MLETEPTDTELLLPGEGRATVIIGLEQYNFNENPLTGAQSRYITTTVEKDDEKKAIRLFTWLRAPYMIINVHRLQMTRSLHKYIVPESVYFPFEIKLPCQKKVLHLVGVVTYSGSHPKGHYVCYFRCPNKPADPENPHGYWEFYNDMSQILESADNHKFFTDDKKTKLSSVIETRSILYYYMPIE